MKGCEKQVKKKGVCHRHWRCVAAKKTKTIYCCEKDCKKVATINGRCELCQYFKEQFFKDLEIMFPDLF